MSSRRYRAVPMVKTTYVKYVLSKETWIIGIWHTNDQIYIFSIGKMSLRQIDFIDFKRRAVSRCQFATSAREAETFVAPRKLLTSHRAIEQRQFTTLVSNELFTLCVGDCCKCTCIPGRPAQRFKNNVGQFERYLT